MARMPWRTSWRERSKRHSEFAVLNWQSRRGSPKDGLLFCGRRLGSVGIERDGMGWAETRHDEEHEKQGGGDQHHSCTKAARVGGDESGEPGDGRTAEACGEEDPSGVRCALGSG